MTWSRVIGTEPSLHLAFGLFVSETQSGSGCAVWTHGLKLQQNCQLKDEAAVRSWFWFWPLMDLLTTGRSVGEQSLTRRRFVIKTRCLGFILLVVFIFKAREARCAPTGRSSSFRNSLKTRIRRLNQHVVHQTTCPYFSNSLNQMCPVQVLEGLCPACCTCFLLQHTIQWLNHLFVSCRSLLITH